MKTSRLYLYNVVRCLLPETRFFRFKVLFLKWCGAKIGVDVRINSSVRIIGTGRLEINDHVWIGSTALIQVSAAATVCIGNNVDIAPCVKIITGSHVVDPVGAHMAGKGVSKSVSIGEGSWLCANAMILPGVMLGRKTLVAAGAVVTKSFLEENILLAGIPAVKKRSY